MKRIVTIGGVSVGLLLLSIIGFGAGRSEVADALMRGDKAAARKLIEQRVDVNAPQADGATALHWAVFQSDKEMVDLAETNIRFNTLAQVAVARFRALHSVISDGRR